MKSRIFLRLMCATLLLGMCFTAEAQKKMSAIEAINARRSIRAYKDKQVDRETLLLVAECGVKAPSALNKRSGRCVSSILRSGLMVVLQPT